ncbi:MAG: MFS transporter, partial [Oscillospiraceae bacterium]|nr:MFS transporter [Oscillospiraceae bacterium]
DFICGAVILFLALSAYSGFLTIKLLLAAQIVVSTMNGLFDPATKAILPGLVEGEKLSRANSSIASLRTLSGLAGPVIGTLLYAVFGIKALFLVNGISFVLSGISETFITYVHLNRQCETKFFPDLLGGFKFVFSQKMIWNLCFFLLAIYALIMPLFSVALPLFFRTSLNYPDTQYGLLQAVFAAGALAGSILAGVLFGKGNKEIKAIDTGLFLIMASTVCFVIMLFPQSFDLLGKGTMLYFCIFACVIGLLSVSVMLINVPVQTLIQKEAPERFMSRVFAVVGMITKGGLPFGALVYGLTLEKIETHWSVLISTCLLLFVSVSFRGFLKTKKSNCP